VTDELDLLVVTEGDKNQKTINNQDSQIVTDFNTNWSALGLSTAERTGSSVFPVL
jgi:hypothetical protein